MKKYLFYILLFIFTLRLFAIGAEKHRKLTFAEEAGWSPFVYGEITPYGGLSYDILEEIFLRMNIDYEINLYPFSRCLIYAKEGIVDGITSLTKNQERSEYLDFTEPHTIIDGLFVFRKEDKNVKWEDNRGYNHLITYRIGIVQDHNYGDEFKKAILQYDLQTDSAITPKQNLVKLKGKRIDVILISELEFNQLVKENKEFSDTFITYKNQINTSSYRIGFSNKSEAKKLIPQINQVISEMKKDGTLEKIWEKYDIGAK